MPKIFRLSLLAMILASSCKPVLKEDRYLLENMMKQEPSQFQYYTDNKDFLEIQIIYTQINRDANNRPEFKSFYFNVDSSCYFFPASTVKFPMVLLALEKMNKLHVAGLDKEVTMLHDSLYEGQRSAHADTSSRSCLPSMAHYIKKILVTSDNDAHNRLYEFLGQKEANEVMRRKGFTIRYLQRISRPLTHDQNRHTERVRFVRDTTEIYSQPMLVADSMIVTDVVLRGEGFIRNDSLIPNAMDFSYRNFFPLTSQQQVLRAFLFPASVPPAQRFDLTKDDRDFVLQYMSQLPGETHYPAYAKDPAYYPAYGKFLMFGNDKGEIPKGIRVFNKVGNAYGYLIDNAYFADFDKKVEFMLSAVIATNTDMVYNDEKYDYKKLGYPFMKNLGKLVYNYELSRKKVRQPDLTEFKMTYEPAPQ